MVQLVRSSEALPPLAPELTIAPPKALTLLLRKVQLCSFAIALPCTDPSLKRPPPLVPVFPLKTQRDKVRTL